MQGKPGAGRGGGSSGLSERVARLEIQWQYERERTDCLLRDIEDLGSALGPIELRLTRIEERLTRRLTPDQWLKLLAGIGLPLAALLLTGNLDTAVRLATKLLGQ